MRIIDQLIKENDRKNVFFFKYRRQIYALKLEIIKAYYKKSKKDRNQKFDFQMFIFKTLFPSWKNCRYLIEKAKAFQSSRYPIIINDDKFIVLGNIDLYLSPELYAKNKSFLRDSTKTGEVNVTSSMLTRFRTQLNDQNYSISKIYGFKNSFAFSQKVMKKDDFVLPDFKIDITIKKPTIVDSVFKKNAWVFIFNIRRRNKNKRNRSWKYRGTTRTIRLYQQTFRKSKFKITNTRVGKFFSIRLR